MLRFDVLANALLGFVCLVILILPHLNPPTAQADSHPPGNVIVEIRWPDGVDADVDLWVQAPGDVPVGYSNKGGRVFNLLRDDLGAGQAHDATNYEVTYSRGVPAGEWVVTVHAYSTRVPYPVEVEVVVSVKRNPVDSAVKLFTRKVVLLRDGQELTVARFKLNEQGGMVGEPHDLPKMLRSAPR